MPHVASTVSNSRHQCCHLHLCAGNTNDLFTTDLIPHGLLSYTHIYIYHCHPRCGGAIALLMKQLPMTGSCQCLPLVPNIPVLPCMMLLKCETLALVSF